MNAHSLCQIGSVMGRLAHPGGRSFFCFTTKNAGKRVIRDRKRRLADYGMSIAFYSAGTEVQAQSL